MESKITEAKTKLTGG